MKMAFTWMLLLWSLTALAESTPESFRITVREVEFPTAGEFVSTTQKRILKNMNANRSGLITTHVWPRYEAAILSNRSLTASLFPPGKLRAYWDPILAESKEYENVKVSRKELFIRRREKRKFKIGEEEWVLTVGKAISEYTSQVTISGPKDFFIPGLESKGFVDGEIWHGVSVMMITDPSSPTMRQIFITVEEGAEKP